jgi:hypothetical protein
MPGRYVASDSTRQGLKLQALPSPLPKHCLLAEVAAVGLVSYSRSIANLHPGPGFPFCVSARDNVDAECIRYRRGRGPADGAVSRVRILTRFSQSSAYNQRPFLLHVVPSTLPCSPDTAFFFVFQITVSYLPMGAVGVPLAV